MAEELGWDDRELLARIAHRSYAHGRTQEEIALEFGLSRPKVQRLQERARTSGIVDIRIQGPPGLDQDRRLEEQSWAHGQLSCPPWNPRGA